MLPAVTILAIQGLTIGWIDQKLKKKMGFK
jgi:hypothetical protein